MKTIIECRSSWYATRYVICPICKQRAGYDYRFDTGTNSVFKCKCNYGIRQIKKLEEKNV